jgi:rubrerythrin
VKRVEFTETEASKVLSSSHYDNLLLILSRAKCDALRDALWRRGWFGEVSENRLAQVIKIKQSATSAASQARARSWACPSCGEDTEALPEGRRCLSCGATSAYP